MNFVDDNIVPLCELITQGLFYVLCVLGLLTFLTIVLSPFAMIYYGFSGITLKIKNHKKKKSEDRMVKTLQDGNTDAYIMQLEQVVHKKLKKKKKHK
jgi:hypothetical protein